MLCLLEMLQRWQIPGELEATRPDNKLFVCADVYTAALTVSVKQQQQHSRQHNRHFSLETMQPVGQRLTVRSVLRWVQSDSSNPNCCVSEFFVRVLIPMSPVSQSPERLPLSSRMLINVVNYSGWSLLRRTCKTSNLVMQKCCSDPMFPPEVLVDASDDDLLQRTCTAGAAESGPKRLCY